MLERRQGAHADVAVSDPVAAEPRCQDDRDVHDEHDDREHHRHQPADRYCHVHVGAVGVTETVLLIAFLDEGADDSDAHDLLAHDAVDGVELLLHLPEQRTHLTNDQAHADDQRRYDDEQEPGQLHILAQRHEDASDAHDRSHDHERERHEHDHLDLLDVIGRAGDQGRCAELRNLTRGERLHLGEHGQPQVATQGHRGFRTEIDGGDRTQDLQHGDDQHHHADPQNVFGVPDDDTLVDDVRVQSRQVQVGQRPDELEQDDEGDGPSVRRKVKAKERQEHCCRLQLFAQSKKSRLTRPGGR